jgi:hypothetical protein
MHIILLLLVLLLQLVVVIVCHTYHDVDLDIGFYTGHYTQTLLWFPIGFYLKF